MPACGCRMGERARGTVDGEGTADSADGGGAAAAAAEGMVTLCCEG